MHRQASHQNEIRYSIPLNADNWRLIQRAILDYTKDRGPDWISWAADLTHYIEESLNSAAAVEPEGTSFSLDRVEGNARSSQAFDPEDYWDPDAYGFVPPDMPDEAVDGFLNDEW